MGTTELLQLILTGGLGGIGAFLTLWLVKWHIPNIIHQQEKLVVTFELALARLDEHCRQETKELRDLSIAMMRQVCDEAKKDRETDRQTAKEAAKEERELDRKRLK